MKITFNFDKDTRSLLLIPENQLESCVLADMATQCEKGTTIVISQDKERTNAQQQATYRVEMKVNGK